MDSLPRGRAGQHRRRGEWPRSARLIAMMGPADHFLPSRRLAAKKSVNSAALLGQHPANDLSPMIEA